jgi:hypothetical protein
MAAVVVATLARVLVLVLVLVLLVHVGMPAVVVAILAGWLAGGLAGLWVRSLLWYLLTPGRPDWPSAANRMYALLWSLTVPGRAPFFVRPLEEPLLKWLYYPVGIASGVLTGLFIYRAL